jgi:hypothetical protein
MKNILAAFILLFSVSASAQHLGGFIKPVEEYDCEKGKKEIIEDLMKPVTCFHDDDCSYFDFGYPWQPNICVKAIINIKQKEKYISKLGIIEQYNQKCIKNNEEENKKFTEFAAELEKQDCGKLPRVYCFKGFCRINNYSIYNEN